MTKSNMKIPILIGVSVILAILTAVMVVKFVIVEESAVSSIPQFCYSSETYTASGIQYTCPSASTGCNVEVELKCDTPVNDGTQKVVSRVADARYDRSTQWIVVKNQYGQLASWTYKQTWRRDITSTSPSATTFDLPYEWKGYFDNMNIGGKSTAVLVIPSPTYYNKDTIPSNTNQWRNCILYVSGGNGNTNPESISNCQNNELCSGSSGLFTCSETSTGDLKLTISDSKTQSWTKTATGTLLPDKTIGWTGQLTSTISYRQESDCDGGEVNPDDANSYYECEIQSNGCGKLSSSLSYCDEGEVYIESKQSCTSPYTVILTTQKQSYSVNETISGNFVIKDVATIGDIPVTMKLYDIQDKELYSQDYRTTSSGKFDFSFPSQKYGTYQIVAVVNHPLKVYTSDPIKFTIVSSMNIVLIPKNTKQNTGEVIITAQIKDSSGSAKTDIDEWDFTGTSCGQKDYSKKTTGEYTTTSTRGAEYTIKAQVDEACSQFVFKVVAIDKTGFRSTPITQIINVEKSSVLIEGLNLDQLYNLEEGSHTFKFLVMDEKRQPITPTTLQVIVQEKGGCKSGEFCSQQGSQFFGKTLPPITATATMTGNYMFNHNFEAGLNYIYITASSGTLSSKTFDTQLYFWQSTDPDDDDDDECEGDECDEEPEPFPTSLVVTIGIVVAGMVFFGLIVFRRKK